MLSFGPTYGRDKCLKIKPYFRKKSLRNQFKTGKNGSNKFFICVKTCFKVLLKLVYNPSKNVTFYRDSIYSVFQNYSFSVETINLHLAKFTSNMFFGQYCMQEKFILKINPSFVQKILESQVLILQILCSTNFIRSTMVNNIFTVL